jgi:hypothetical protein
MKLLSDIRGTVRRWHRWSRAGRTVARQLANLQGRDPGGIAVPALEFSGPDRPGPEQLEICRRVIEAYHAARAEAGREFSGDGVWDDMSAVYHRELAEAIRGRDAGRAAEILGRMFVDPVAHGLALGRDAFLAARYDPRPTALDWHDKAISLGIACGVIPDQCPEQGEYGTLLDEDSVEVVRRVGSLLGIDPAPPQAGAVFGVRVGGGLVPTNHLLHLYTAHRVRTILGTGAGAGDCVEIGGGVGFLAYVGRRMGFRSHTIYDLPLVGAIQGYYLLRSSVAADVRLFGEGGDDDGAGIALRPWFAFGRGDRPADIVINQDSLPEMGAATMAGYLGAIPAQGARFFLSINQEARVEGQGWVHDSCRGLAGMELVYRAPYWLRKGYVEELYRLGGGRAGSDGPARRATP